jgi:two-component system, OmpR family, sensor histidine kinase CiaH
MNALTKRRLAIVTTVYWVLLVYIIAALVWWFIALQNQNKEMTALRTAELRSDDKNFETQKDAIVLAYKRKTAQYLSEGLTFLALILIGAVYVYRAVRRQIRMQLQQQNFMMAVTHELKTPIAVAQLNLETMQKHKLDDAKQQKLITMTLQETNRLNHLASNILVSSQLEGGKYQLTKEEIDFSSLVSDCVHEFIHRFPERNLKVDLETGIEIIGDPLLLQILVNNLIENALKYSPRGSTITARLKKNRRVILEIVDEGSGIPDDEKKNVFRKFYRIGNEQTRSAKGTGLGLYLCKKIAHDHRATIHVSDNIPTGSIFTVSFA